MAAGDRCHTDGRLAVVILDRTEAARTVSNDRPPTP